jgi:hypothetical protein
MASFGPGRRFRSLEIIVVAGLRLPISNRCGLGRNPIDYLWADTIYMGHRLLEDL